MKKIYISEKEIYKIAKLIKSNFPDQKIYLHKVNNKIVIKLPKNFDFFKKEELRTLIKMNFPEFQLIFQYNY